MYYTHCCVRINHRSDGLLNGYTDINILIWPQKFQNFCIPGCLLIHLNIIIQHRYQSSSFFYRASTMLNNVFNPFSTRPHQNVVWCNNSWLGFLQILNYVQKERDIFSAKNEPSFVTVKMLRWLIGIILGEIICKSSNWQHIQRLKITILGANWQLFRLERIAKCSYFIWSTQNIKFYWFVMKMKKFLLPIWWYNRGLFPLRNKYFGVFVLIGLKFQAEALKIRCPFCKPITWKCLHTVVHC